MTTETGLHALSDRELVVSRVIDGPRTLVYKAFTQVEHLAQWWGPNGFTTTTHRFDFRPGGVWEFIMHGPDGTDYPNYIEYREIVPFERIVLFHGDSATDPNAFISTITFADRGAATEIVMRALFTTRERRDFVVERFGAIEGGKQTLARLATYVATLPVGSGS